MKSLLSTLTSRGPHRVLRGNLAIAGQPGVVFTPESGRGLPAVVFGHGWLTGVGNYRELLEHLASWGFVAAAPDTERGPIPSHLGLATDLLTTVDICTGVRLGDGEISVNPERIALAGHGMGAGAAVIAASQRRVAALAALFPAPTAPSAETLAPNIDIPALVLAGSTDIASVNSNALPLTSAWAALRCCEPSTARVRTGSSKAAAPSPPSARANTSPRSPAPPAPSSSATSATPSSTRRPTNRSPTPKRRSPTPT